MQASSLREVLKMQERMLASASARSDERSGGADGGTAGQTEALLRSWREKVLRLCAVPCRCA
jgi:hypothetical protein